MRKPLSLLLTAASLGLFGAACAPVDGELDAALETDAEVAEAQQPFASKLSTLMDFELDAKLVTSATSNFEAEIIWQWYYAVGALNGDKATPHLDEMQLTNITSRVLASGLTEVSYHANVPVSWGAKTGLPTSYAFTLPLRVDAAGRQDFATKYSVSCAVPMDGHEIGASNMWFYYKPKKAGCSIATADALRSTATAVVSKRFLNTTGKYPEYHRIWEDGALNVVAIFGKFEDGKTTSADYGIAAYNSFVAQMKTYLPTATTTPAVVPTSPGVGTPDVVFRYKRSNGMFVTVTALLVDNPVDAGATFDARFGEVSAGADLIMYNGHSGFGANVRAMAQKGNFFSNKYQVFLFGGCDTFSYVDHALANRRAELNPGDPTGTKNMEVIATSMPSWFKNYANNAMGLIKGLNVSMTGSTTTTAAPETWETYLGRLDASQLSVVIGEEDNVYKAGAAFTRPTYLADINTALQGQVKQYSTSSTTPLAAGTYVVEMTHDQAKRGGDADLRVRVGSAPTADVADCKPYLEGSNERCEVTLTAPGRIFASVTGYNSTNSYVLRAFKK